MGWNGSACERRRVGSAMASVSRGGTRVGKGGETAGLGRGV